MHPCADLKQTFLNGRQRDLRAKLGAFHTEKSFDIAHVGVLRQKSLREGQVGGHVGHLHHQQEIGAR